MIALLVTMLSAAALDQAVRYERLDAIADGATLPPGFVVRRAHRKWVAEESTYLLYLDPTVLMASDPGGDSVEVSGPSLDGVWSTPEDLASGSYIIQVLKGGWDDSAPTGVVHVAVQDLAPLTEVDAPTLLSVGRVKTRGRAADPNAGDAGESLPPYGTLTLEVEIPAAPDGRAGWVAQVMVARPDGSDVLYAHGPMGTEPRNDTWEIADPTLKSEAKDEFCLTFTVRNAVDGVVRTDALDCQVIPLPAESCGCSQGTAPSAWMVLWIPGLVALRRRGKPTRPCPTKR